MIQLMILGATIFRRPIFLLSKRGLENNGEREKKRNSNYESHVTLLSEYSGRAVVAEIARDFNSHHWGTLKLWSPMFLTPESSISPPNVPQNPLDINKLEFF